MGLQREKEDFPADILEGRIHPGTKSIVSI
jgi:hypothetical protein